MTEKAVEVKLFGFSYNFKGTVIMNKSERFVIAATANLRLWYVSGRTFGYRKIVDRLSY
jgi:hypothetical protein